MLRLELQRSGSEDVGERSLCSDSAPVAKKDMAKTWQAQVVTVTSVSRHMIMIIAIMAWENILMRMMVKI